MMMARMQLARLGFSDPPKKIVEIVEKREEIFPVERPTAAGDVGTGRGRPPDTPLLSAVGDANGVCFKCAIFEAKWGVLSLNICKCCCLIHWEGDQTLMRETKFWARVSPV